MRTSITSNSRRRMATVLGVVAGMMLASRAHAADPLALGRKIVLKAGLRGDRHGVTYTRRRTVQVETVRQERRSDGTFGPATIVDAEVVPVGKKHHKLLPSQTIEPSSRGRQRLTSFSHVFTHGGLRMGKAGALTYLLDSEGRAVSDGFHRIFFQNRLLLGKTGAMTYVLDPYTFQTVTAGHHKIHPAGKWLTGTTGARMERLGVRYERVAVKDIAQLLK
jgi:hypothetical protein